MLQSAHDCPRVHTTAPICCAVSHAPLFVLFFPTCHTPFFVFRCVSSAALLYETEARNQTRSAFVRGGSGGSGGSGGGSGSGSGDSGSGDSGSGDSVSGSGGSGSGSGDSGSGGSGSGGSGSGDSGSGDSGGYVESGDAGATLELACETPVKVHLPGGSVFADPRTLGSGLHYKGPSHSGAFAYVTATDGGSRAADAAATRAMSRHWVYTFTYYASGGAATPQLGSRRFFFDPDGWPVLEQELSAQWEGGCAAAQARPYGAKSSSRTHCTHHAARGSHCTGTVLHRTHPGVSSNGAERDALHGQIDVEGSAGWRREQVDQCSVLGQTGSDGGDRGSGDSGSGDSGYDGDDDDVHWPDIAASDVAGLWALYMSTGGPNWPPDESYGWSETAQHACSNWSGVICDSNDRVLGLDLTWRPMLSGTLPFEIAALRRLEELHISNTSLSGTLPASIALLNASREWVLSHNRLSGSINAPDEGVGDALPYLTRVLTNDNYFSGTIPAGLGELSNLRELLANDNYFSGTLPAGLGELSNLQELRFENNPMSGTVPLSFANLKSLSSCGLGEGMDLYCSEFQSMAGACSGYSCTPPPPASPLGSSGDSGDNGSGDRGSGDSGSGDSGSGDSGSIDPVGVSAPLPRENLRGNCLGGCRPLACAATPACRADTRTRAAAGTLDACDPAYAARCRSHALLTATPWEPHELEGAAPLYVTRRGTELAQTSQETPTPAHASCHASEHVSRITPSRGPLDGGTSVTVHGTGFGAPARCRFGSVERANLVVSSHEIVCTSPQLDEVYSSGTLSAFLSRPGGVEVLRRQASLSQVSHPFTTHWPHPIFQTPFVTPHLPLPICHTPFATLHSPHPIRYIPCVAPHVSHPILTIHHRLFLLPNLTSSRFASRFR